MHDNFLAQNANEGPSNRIMNYELFYNTRKSLSLITPVHIGKWICLNVTSKFYVPKEETITPVETQNLICLDRWVYGVKAASIVSMSRPANKELLTKAESYYQAGKLIEATQYANQYLSAIRMRFNVSVESTRQFEVGQMVDCVIDQVPSQSTGEFQLVLKGVCPVPVHNTKPVKHSMNDLLSAVPEEKLWVTLPNGDRLHIITGELIPTKA